MRRVRTSRLMLLGSLSSFGLQGCVLDTYDPGGSAGPPRCSNDSQCRATELCEPVDALCVARSTPFDRVLLEIIPPGSEPGFGGAHLFQIHAGLGQPGPLTLGVRRPLRVTGFFQANEQSTPCTAGSTTHEARVTFRPRESLLGIEAPRYATQTEPVIVSEGGELHCFEAIDDAPSGRRIEHCLRAIDLPPGRYDVYIEPTGQEAPGCKPIVPQIRRDLDLRAEEGASAIRLLQAPTPALALTIPWQSSLDGYVLDVVHDVTGEVISNRIPLLQSSVIEGTDRFEGMQVVRAELEVSVVIGVDFSEPGRELLRLTPPEGRVAPQFFFSRSALEATPGEAVLPTLPTLGEAVELHAWVLGPEPSEQAVPARVRFDAVQLTGLARGLFASFSASADTGERGEVVVSLLQGQYRVRTVPSADTTLSALQSDLTIWPPDATADLPRQAGQVIRLPRAARLDARLSSADSLAGVVAAHATPAKFLHECVTTPEAIPGLNCRRQGSPVLSSALAGDPFIPRVRAQWLGEEPEVALDVDCGACEPAQGAGYDVSLRPEPTTGLAWVTFPALSVSEPLSMGEIDMHAGVVLRGLLQFLTLGEESGVFPGALIRTYVLQDDAGQVGAFDEGLEPCVALRSRVDFMGQRCAANAVLVHETRVDQEGQFRLLLPTAIGVGADDVSD